jgi:septal ring factor EnvC (AmiA/AmiB activator)
MPEIEAELRRLRDQITDVTNRLIRLEVKLQSLCQNMERDEQHLERYIEQQGQKSQRIPTIILGVIAGATGVVSVFVQIMMTR